MRFSRQSHAVFYARYHLVISTKYRRKILKSGMGSYMCTLMKAICRRHPEIEVHELNVSNDHVHLLISVAPKMALAEAVRIIKSNTALMMSRRFPFLKKTYWNENAGIWSVGYFVSTVGVNEEIIRKYIEMQGEEDSGRAKLEIQ